MPKLILVLSVFQVTSSFTWLILSVFCWLCTGKTCEPMMNGLSR